MTLTYNHFENKFNQLGHLKTLLYTLKLLKSDHEIPRYVTFTLQLAAILDLAEKEG